jgi:hypothetical protein
MRRYSGDQPLDQSVLSDIQRRAAALNIEETLESRELPFNLNRSPNYPILQCNMSRVAEWKRASANSVLGQEDMLRLERNVQNSFTVHAIEATRRVAKAFRLVNMGVFLAAGTMLGWYRECGVIAHTEDIDLAYLADHIVSMEHFDLLIVSLHAFSFFPSDVT